MTDNDDVARELIGSAGLPPDMPRVLSNQEAEDGSDGCRLSSVT